jgi:hypothetical protein
LGLSADSFFAAAPSAAGTALPAASVCVDGLLGFDFALGFEGVFFEVVVLPLLLAGCVLVAAASRARTKRFIIHIQHHATGEVSILVEQTDRADDPEVA